MKFNEKLDFLMTVTKTSNSALSLYTSVDASYISRLRRGERRLPRNENFSRKMSEYLAGHFASPIQKRTLFETLGYELKAETEQGLSSLIYQWLMTDDSDNPSLSHGYFSDFPEIEFRKKPDTTDSRFSPPNPRDTGTSVYLGNEGKRAAFLCFLSQLIEEKKPQTVLFFSDEDAAWSIEDPKFISQWQEMMLQIIGNGHKIIVIHNLQSPLDELVKVCDCWLPLQLTGSVSAYYCPLARDGIFRRTMYIAPENSVLFSSGVRGNTGPHSNILMNDKEIVSSFEEEFYQFLKMCRHLFWVVRPNSLESLIHMIMEFDKEPADTTVRSGYLTINTMSQALFESIVSNRFDRKDFFLDFFSRWKVSFRKLMRTHVYSEILHLPSVETIKEGKLKIVFSELANGTPLYYTVEECIQHLGNMIHMLKTNDNYHLYLTGESRLNNGFLYFKDNFGALILNASVPPAISLTDEDTTLAVIHTILSAHSNMFSYPEPLRKDAIEKLQKTIDNLRK
ncbi:hypothetical protein [Parasporobacterium paucivorans]|uniref:Uncharacterized protein n=1 Tax=Parasporobacterium paucivorans DSM 15970 TaxID=1122934 RepID=A0A1M6J0G1_9FIRM|nr:hypothetical protein [Parasporobacterium paucivorans]SHJ40140.1 hypothetical protein SAMN02745691_01885 [Parasporobacterium paucivorans DSM 15970]